MKLLNQTFKIILIASFSFVFSCKENEIANNKQELVKNDTVAALEIKDTIVKESSENKECLQKSNFKLPYSQKIDIKKVKYETCNCKIEGIDELLCDNPTLRYISLPNFENRKVILVPVDCGDFNYRFYLATTFENKLLSKLYVEGEWYEPGDDSYKEISSFSIDENYKIVVTKKSFENEKNSTTKVTNYTIDPDGIFVKE